MDVEEWCVGIAHVEDYDPYGLGAAAIVARHRHVGWLHHRLTGFDRDGRSTVHLQCECPLGDTPISDHPPVQQRRVVPHGSEVSATQSRPRVVAKLAHRSCADQYRLKESSVDASNVLEADYAHQPSHLLHCNREIAGLQDDGLGCCAVHWRELE
jgi:hypothetical protein